MPDRSRWHLTVGLAVFALVGTFLVFNHSKDCAKINPENFATVNGQPLTVAELKTALYEAGGMRTNEPFDKLVKKVVQDLIDAELIFQEYADRYPTASGKQEVIRRVLSKHVHQKTSVSEREVVAFFEKHFKGKTGFELRQFRQVIRKQIVLEKEHARYQVLVNSLRAEATIAIDADCVHRACYL